MLLPSTMASLFRRAFAISLAGQRFHRYTGNRRDMMSGAPIVQTNSKRPILVSFLGAWERGYHHSLHPLFPGHSHLQYFDYSVCQTFCILQEIKYWRWEVAYCKRSKLEVGSCILQAIKYWRWEVAYCKRSKLEAGSCILQAIKYWRREIAYCK